LSTLKLDAAASEISMQKAFYHKRTRDLSLAVCSWGERRIDLERDIERKMKREREREREREKRARERGALSASTPIYILLVQLPGFARVRPQPPTLQPTHTTPTPNKPKSKKNGKKKRKNI
jgi:hypothetical protein